MKICFITYHNWDTKRHGGFHALAEYACKCGHEVVFFSFSRPYYSFFLKDERINKKSLLTLSKGKYYKVGENSIYNVTWPTLSLYGRLRRLVPKAVNMWLDTHSLYRFGKFADKHLGSVDVFVIESNESVLLFDKIRRKYPKAKITYRPSDPIVDYNSALADNEIYLVRNADMNFIVTQEGVELYRKYIPNFDQSCKYQILHNGISLDEYQKHYNKPKLMFGNKVVLYLGVEPIEWKLVIDAAKQIQNAEFFIVTPNPVPNDFIHAVKKQSNLHYISGVYPREVPAWITNCDVVITPLITNFHKKRKSIHISAKNLKPIAAGKPIVTYCNNPCLSQYGIINTYTFSDFINALAESIDNPKVHYCIDIDNYDWSKIGEQFIRTLEKL